MTTPHNKTNQFNPNKNQRQNHKRNHKNTKKEKKKKEREAAQAHAFVGSRNSSSLVAPAYSSFTVLNLTFLMTNSSHCYKWSTIYNYRPPPNPTPHTKYESCVCLCFLLAIYTILLRNEIPSLYFFFSFSLLGCFSGGVDLCVYVCEWQFCVFFFFLIL